MFYSAVRAPTLLGVLLGLKARCAPEWLRGEGAGRPREEVPQGAPPKCRRVCEARSSGRDGERRKRPLRPPWPSLPVLHHGKRACVPGVRLDLGLWPGAACADWLSGSVGGAGALASVRRALLFSFYRWGD